MRILTVKGIIILTLALLLSAAPEAFAQRRQQQRPVRSITAAPASAAGESKSNEPEERAAEKRIVTVTLKEGAPVTGEYQNAGANTLFLVVAGNRLSIKLDDVKAIYFGEASPSEASTAAPSPAVAAPQTGNISIEVGIIYKMGGNQPVARTEFMLLDQSLENILAEAGVPQGQTGVLSSYAFARLYPNQFPGMAERAQAAIKQHTVQSVSTDFSGKAQFTDIKPGNYYIGGLASTRGGFAIWNLPVEVKAGQNSFLLDQNNAATAF
jgi:hypothetical protein